MTIELRNLTFEVSESEGTFGDQYQDIDAYINGEQVGYLSLTIDAENKIIKVDLFEVDEEYQSLGIGTAIYKEFGKLYESSYNGWAVERYFVNPIAEYAFRKAVSLGWVSEKAISEDHIKRNQNPINNQLWQDLRQKLPENVQGPETWAIKQDLRKILAASTVDLRNIQMDTSITDEEIDDEDEEDYYKGITYKISAMVNGTEAGYLSFVETTTNDETYLYLAKIEVQPEYREFGIGTLLYKEFGSIYSQKYSGWEVERHFENPIAEYAFKKAIELGYVPSDAFTEERTTRQYDTNQQNQWDNELSPRLQ